MNRNGSFVVLPKLSPKHGEQNRRAPLVSWRTPVLPGERNVPRRASSQLFDGPAQSLGRIKVPACAVKTKLDTRRESFCLSFGQALCLPAITIIILFIVQIEINFFYGIFKEAATQITPSRETAGCEFGSRIPLVV
jgi:hypothetical protein